MWLDSGKSKLLKDIAQELQISEEQVRKWKNQDKWDTVTLPNANSNVTNQRGGQPGNKNAAGNSGGAAPQKNKNAIKTGEFETLFFDALDFEERRLVQSIQPDKEQLLLQEIQLLTVRERRMLKRIEALRQIEELCPESKDDPVGMSVVKVQSGIEKGKHTDLKEYAGILGQIQSVEDALTRVQARRQKAIESLHRFGYDDARLELDVMKLEYEMTKQDAGENMHSIEDLSTLAELLTNDENTDD